MVAKAKRNGSGHLEPGLVRVSRIRPSPENDKLYRPINPDDPAIIALADSIGEIGVREPLVVTLDGWILSGHRRYAAANLAGLDSVPIRVEPIYRDDPQFVTLLREYNRQREKSLDEKLREEVVSANPEEAHRVLLEHRRQQANPDLSGFTIRGRMQRNGVSSAKQPMLDAAIAIIDNLRTYWPLTIRRIHYRMIGKEILRNIGKPDSTYINDQKSYKDLADLLTRARLTGEVPMECIADETRTVATWAVHHEPPSFIRAEIDRFLKGYYRDLMQSQPNHLEIIGEKNTIKPIIDPIAGEYTIPYTIGRGYASLPPRNDLAHRFARSGKEKLILLMLSDFDAEGEDMNNSFAKSLRDDFGIDGDNIVPIKVAINKEQAEEYGLPESLDAKSDTARQRKFIERHGSTVYEIDALDPADIQQELRRAIDSVIDVAAFNHEIDREKRDAAFLDTVRQRVHAALKGVEGIGSNNGK